MLKLFNDGWQFAKGEPCNFTQVKLPHDWLISDVNKLYESGTGWYKNELDSGFLTEGQRLFLRFDGVYMDSTLYVNDRVAGEWKYGYTAFEYDITDFLNKEGGNTILLKVNYMSPSSRWYTGAGIYRDVFLKVKNACHFVSDGIYISTGKQDGQWVFEVDAEVEGAGYAYEVKHTLLDVGDSIVPWDIDNPRLYTLRSELLVDGKVTDTELTRFGFRTIDFSSDKGFFLNERHVKLKGVCLHHDLGALGAAVHSDAIRRQLTLFKDMGVNALRTAHNPPAKVFMELADEMGFLVMSEILDMWTQPKNTHDYARFFDDWIEKDVASWIRRDRNHPSIIMWSIGNEIHDTHLDAQAGAQTMERLMALVRRHDSRQHAPITLCSNYMPWENTQKCADIIKLIGYNYGESLYNNHHSEHPDWIIFGSETCSTVQSRGVYHFPLNKSILSDDDLQCSALGNSSTSWGAKSVEACIRADFDTPYSLGQFIWVGQDHLGEPTPYHTKNSYLGHIDTAGFPKDSYYLFQAAWTDYKKAPMVHLFPHWDFSPGQLIDIRVCSNAPRIELFLDNESLGSVLLEGKYVADWQMPYRPGLLHAVAYDESGTVIAQDRKGSFGDVDRLHLHEDTYGELVFVTITALDKNGAAVENANCRVRVEAENGILLGLDNGDSTDFEQYQTNSRRLFSGKLLAIVKSRNGKAPRISVVLDKDDVPIRKIELSVSAHTVTAQIFPPDATYDDLYWRLTDAGGNDSPLGTLAISEDGKSATVVPKGDGQLYVRCAVKNGSSHVTIISQQVINVSGMGKAFLNPYSFISAGLYNYSNVELTNGNERGIATLRSGKSHVGFKDIDFGDYGSDQITLPLFPLGKEPFTFEIWEGMPLENGTRLCTAAYDKGSIWNTYQEVTCTLPRRLRGVTGICLVFDQKVHIKGFHFKKYHKAFQRLCAAEYDAIYGDTFSVKETAIENIGNNVSILFENMDFGSSGASSIALSWRSKIPGNSIQLLFTDPQNKTQKMIFVDGSADYTSAVFPLGEKIMGNKTVTLVFLPGSSLDLSWFQFME
ncbi:beta-galactosidase BoGH2A precursor [Ruminiclostridium hungatei]|uniref:Beta-galactosidase BoGH2A n=1 Tax=Ruminiclostridium hungatei TaxID=48256 RepID=A0A1V4SNY3_RUMHU|nr:glycoside hydrolase family 2 TIM barrel-domain containing protein [Ruminiclostridium hungatei]OPX45608.1 beta-galactosidase BoGH2A precursor [Ruminiclostridium hungatei]